MQILAMLTGLSATALVGTAIVSQNDALTQPQTRSGASVNAVQQNDAAVPQSPLPPNLVRDAQDASVVDAQATLNATTVNVAPTAPATVSQ